MQLRSSSSHDSVHLRRSHFRLQTRQQQDDSREHKLDVRPLQCSMINKLLPNLDITQSWKFAGPPSVVAKHACPCPPQSSPPQNDQKCSLLPSQKDSNLALHRSKGKHLSIRELECGNAPEPTFQTPAFGKISGPCVQDFYPGLGHDSESTNHPSANT